MLAAVCGAQLSHASYLVVDATVTASVPNSMIAAQMFHLLLTTNTAVSMHACMHTHTCTHTRAHTHKHTHTHTHTHIREHKINVLLDNVC